MSEYTAELSEAIASLELEEVPAPVAGWMKLLVLDGLGCGLIGSTLPWCRKVTAYSVETSAAGCGTVWGTRAALSPAYAGYCNGTFVHSFEFDDLHLSSWLHLMSFVLPPALALGEDRRASGRDVLTAVIAGADTGVRVALAVDMTGLNRYGAHPTGALGQFGSAAAAAKVLGFGPEEVAGTLGLAGSAALGTEIIKSEGSHLKRLYAGRASRAGVECALLTERGFAGPRRVFETPYGGVFSVLWAGTPAPGYDFGRLTAGLGRDFGELLRVGVKPYPMHQHTHAALDCARALVRSGAFRFEEVERVVVRCRTRSTRVLNHPEPATVMNAQQSLPYGVAVMLRDGELTVRQVSEERVRDPEVRRFARERIALVPLPEADEAFPEKDPAEVEVRTKSGAVFRHREEVGGGQPGRPMPPEEIREKFRANAAPVLGPDRAERVIAAVERLEELPDAGELTALLRPEE